MATSAMDTHRDDVTMAPSAGNLWQQLLRDSSVRSKLPVAQLVVVGDHECGKTALLSRLNELPAKSPLLSPSLQPLNGPETTDGARSMAGELLSYSSLHVLDPKAKEGGNSSSDAAEDVIAQVNAWALSDLSLVDLMGIALKPSTLSQTIVAVVVDLSRPWAIKNSIEQWTSALEGQLLKQINQLPTELKTQLYQNVKQHLLEYEDPSLESSLPKAPMELSNKKEFLEEGTLAKNLGVPLIIIVSKSDLRPENSVKMDYIEFVLRQFAIKYGAAIVYTSAKTGTNIDLLRTYLVHRALPAQFKFDTPPQLVDRGAIFVPAGYDSIALVNQSLVGAQPKWPADKPFEKIVPTPPDELDDSSRGTSPGAGEVKLDSHEHWLEKLERAAGAGLEELQKQSVEASKKAEAAAAARRAAAERRKREEKDVSSTHLANFFNNLLSRPEKSKSSRSLDVKKKEKSESVKSLAEQELQSLAKRTPSGNSGGT
ncbi:hypothetical protein PINS_up005075 [Pythium insidiosum]|nr:hypothetical protein PINS_up005075 [Pythium insidiosum]